MNKKIFLLFLLGIFLIWVINIVSADMWTNTTTYYNFTNITFTNDSTGNGHTLTETTATKNSSGIIGDGRNITGGLLSRTTNDFNFSSNDFTINIWIKPDVNTEGDIIGTLTGSGAGWIITNYPAGTLKWIEDIDGAGFSLDFGALKLGKWQMLTARRSGTNLSLWINASCVASHTAVNVTGGVGILSIGRGASGHYSANSFLGTVDEITIKNSSAWGDSEIVSAYNLGLALGYGISPPSATSLNVFLVYPENNSISISGNINFTSNYTATSINITNATYSIWYNNGSIYNKTTINVNMSYNVTFLNLTSIPINTYKWNVLACGKNTTTTICSSAGNRTFFVKAFTENSILFNTTSYEMLQESFVLNISTSYSLSNATIVYNGTSYSSTINTISGNYIITNNLTVPIVDLVIINNSFHWNLNFANFSQDSLTYGQNASRVWFLLCNSTFNIPYINFTFQDEVSNDLINASISTSTFTYWITNRNINRTFTLINNTENPNYAFCFSPPYKTINVNSYIQYKGTSYPQRVFNNLYSLTNTTTNKILYLLSSTDGIYVTFQVLGSGGQPLNEVSTTANRTIGSSIETIAYGLTGSDGGVTFWLNPDFLHTFLFNKVGVGNYLFSTYPTQTLYTVTLGGGTTQNFTDYTQGVSEIIQPSSDYINYGTIYSFNYTTLTNYWTLSQFGFNLVDSNGTIITTQSSAANGGTINYNMNATTSGRYIMNYYYVANSTYVNGSRYWIVQKSTNYSIFHFFTDLGLYIGQNLFGINGDEGNSNFGMALLSVVILVGVTGGMVMRYGVASEAAIMGLIFGLVLTLNSLGFIPNPSFITTGTLGNFIVYITFVLLVAFIYKGEQR